MRLNTIGDNDNDDDAKINGVKFETSREMREKRGTQSDSQSDIERDMKRQGREDT